MTESSASQEENSPQSPASLGENAPAAGEQPILGRRELLLDTPRFRVVRQEYTARDGKTVHKDVVLHPGAVVILPILPDGRLCLIRNFRASVGRELLELPAGTREPGEPPEITAARELEEETGFRAGRLEKLAEFFVSPGILSERMHLYRAVDLVAGPTSLMPDERIVNVLLTPAEARRLLDAGEIEDAKTLIGLMLHFRPAE